MLSSVWRTCVRMSPWPTTWPLRSSATCPFRCTIRPSPWITAIENAPNGAQTSGGFTASAIVRLLWGGYGGTRPSRHYGGVRRCPVRPAGSGGGLDRPILSVPYHRNMPCRTKLQTIRPSTIPVRPRLSNPSRKTAATAAARRAFSTYTTKRLRAIASNWPNGRRGKRNASSIIEPGAGACLRHRRSGSCRRGHPCPVTRRHAAADAAARAPSTMRRTPATPPSA
jgi:hypothetical protein